jgi:surfactin synthase thioesterase subunit
MMKHYKDANNKLFGIADGEPVPAGLTEITKVEAERIGKLNYEKFREEELVNMDYVRQRLTAYPELGEFVDAWVKNDQAALEEYRRKCLAVKSKYPKPPGF